MFINLFLLVRTGSILAIFKINQEVLSSIESCHFNLYNEIAIFQPVNENFYKAQVSFPSNFTSFFSAIKHITPLYIFSSNILYFVQKNHIKVQIFEIFECSGQNLSNSSCQFWNDKSISIQIWYHSSLSWQKTSP